MIPIYHPHNTSASKVRPSEMLILFITLSGCKIHELRNIEVLTQQEGAVNVRNMLGWHTTSTSASRANREIWVTESGINVPDFNLSCLEELGIDINIHDFQLLRWLRMQKQLTRFGRMFISWALISRFSQHPELAPFFVSQILKMLGNFWYLRQSSWNLN